MKINEQVLVLERLKRKEQTNEQEKQVISNAITALKNTCSHVNAFSYNHGYHKICEDCGLEL